MKSTPKSLTLGALHLVAYKLFGGEEIEPFSSLVWDAKLPAKLFAPFILDLPGVKDSIQIKIEESPEIAELRGKIVKAEDDQVMIMNGKGKADERLARITEIGRAIIADQDALNKLLETQNDVEAFILRKITEMFGVEKLQPGIDTIKIKQYGKKVKAKTGADFLIAMEMRDDNIPIAKIASPNILEVVFEIPTNGKKMSPTRIGKEVAKLVGEIAPTDGINGMSKFDISEYNIQERLISDV